ncbi:alpha/beta fold hydrolase [Zooshikella harenae]|uniref:Alpha/beta hydrolase n=1 Tax=Zooshikella harenae TaxID=2827238 RepID=A0ABS5ZG07_9GAMM|nr:alpha/beta hydrolase [Zooshikella harenae]MBU2712997.1 alpha/beta hydrolase [Zooshikella harenae]
MNTLNYREALIEKIETPIQQGRVAANSVMTSYISAGAGFPVVLLHGAGAGAVTWYPSISAIAEKFHVIAPDIVGYGESDKPSGAYDRPYFSAWLKGFLSALKITKAHIVGLSQGGAIALQFALDYPDLVDKLVLVDAGALGAKPSFMPFLGMLWMNSAPSRLANSFFSRYLLFKPEKRDPNHGYYSIEVLKQKGGKNAFTQGRGSAVSAIPEESLQQIKSETLIIWGENDQLFSVEYGETAARIIPNATFYRIQEAGHLSLMDQPEIFNKALLDFLNDQSKDNEFVG